MRGLRTAAALASCGALSALLCAGVACDRTPASGQGVSRPDLGRSALRRAALGPPQSARAREAALAGKIPFAYPVTRTSAKVGDYVLAPSASWIEEAVEKGGDKQTFIYYGGWLREAGERASEVETLTRQRALIPNPFIIPIPSGARARVADIVLTTWASGSGMQRAIVVGGEPATPSVRYLDLELENPSGFGKKEDTLPPNTFRVLSAPGEVGSSIACREGARHTRWIIAHASAEQLLALGFAGRMRVFARAECQNVPLQPALEAGDTAYVPLVGAFTRATVTRVDARAGRVFAKYDFGGEVKEDAFAFTNVLDELRSP